VDGGGPVTGQAVLAAAVFAGLGWAVVRLLAAAAGGPAGHATSPAAGLVWWRAVSSRTAVAAAGAGLAAGLLTRWPVAVLAAAGLVGSWRWLFGAAGAQAAAISRLEALATWTESLRDTVAGAVGLEQAIPATVDGAGSAIRLALLRLRGRLQARLPLTGALYELAEELDDPSADLVVAALILNAGLRGPGLQATLGALAAAAREQLDMRRRVEAGRRGVRQGARIVAGVTVGFVAVLATVNRSYLAPYGTPVGQLVLAAVVGMFAAGFGLLHRLSTVEPTARLLAPPPGTAAGVRR
jgi:Flp pilus assembly protein TadB